jgi:serine/threonine protein kinase, bacterial
MGLAFDSAGDLYMGSAGWNAIVRIPPTGTFTTFASAVAGRGLAFEDDGDLVASTGNFDVKKITPAGSVGPTIGTFGYPNGLAIDDAGNIYIANSNNASISRVSAAGVVTPGFATGMNSPQYLAFPIPEPSALALLTLSAGVILRRRRLH